MGAKTLDIILMELATILRSTTFLASAALAQFASYAPNDKCFFIGVASDGAYESGDFEFLNVDALISVEFG